MKVLDVLKNVILYDVIFILEKSLIIVSYSFYANKSKYRVIIK